MHYLISGVILQTISWPTFLLNKASNKTSAKIQSTQRKGTEKKYTQTHTTTHLATLRKDQTSLQIMSSLAKRTKFKNAIALITR